MDALAKMVDPALKVLYPVKSLSRFADVIALCVKVMYTRNSVYSNTMSRVRLLLTWYNYKQKCSGGARVSVTNVESGSGIG